MSGVKRTTAYFTALKSLAMPILNRVIESPTEAAKYLSALQVVLNVGDEDDGAISSYVRDIYSLEGRLSSDRSKASLYARMIVLNETDERPESLESRLLKEEELPFTVTVEDKHYIQCLFTFKNGLSHFYILNQGYGGFADEEVECYELKTESDTAGFFEAIYAAGPSVSVDEFKAIAVRHLYIAEEPDYTGTLRPQTGGTCASNALKNARRLQLASFFLKKDHILGTPFTAERLWEALDSATEALKEDRRSVRAVAIELLQIFTHSLNHATYPSGKELAQRAYGLLVDALIEYPKYFAGPKENKAIVRALAQALFKSSLEGADLSALFTAKRIEQLLHNREVILGALSESTIDPSIFRGAKNYLNLLEPLLSAALRVSLPAMLENNERTTLETDRLLLLLAHQTENPTALLKSLSKPGRLDGFMEDLDTVIASYASDRKHKLSVALNELMASLIKNSPEAQDCTVHESSIVIGRGFEAATTASVFRCVHGESEMRNEITPLQSAP